MSRERNTIVCPDSRAGCPAEIDVWRADLSQAEALPAVARTLSPGERARAGRLRKAADRRRFILAHGALRTILASYMDRDAGDLVFRSGPGGKPALSGGSIRFNLSHSRDLAICAVSRAADVGVDVEYVVPEVARTLARHLSLRTRRRLHALSEAARPHAFFLAWTRMECCAKAGGEGLGRSGDVVDLERFLGPIASVERESGRWLHDFTPAPGYVGTVAAAHAGCRLTFWKLDTNLNPTRGWE